MKKKIFLFSPFGMVGEKLCDVLLSAGHDVKYMTRNQCTLQPEEEIDVCIYTAGLTSARKAKTARYIQDNCYTATKISTLCQQHKVKKIIYLSSDEVYGELITENLTKDSDRINLNSYAMTKYLSEQVIAESGIPYCILRLPGIVGGSKRGNSFLERTICRMKNDEEVICYNFDKDFNNVVHLDDLCNFILRLIDVEIGNKIVHLGQTQKEPLSKVLGYLKEKLGSKSEFVIDDNANRRYFSIPTLAAEEIGYHSRGIYHILDELVKIETTNQVRDDIIFNDKGVCRISNNEINALKNKLAYYKKTKLCLHQSTEERLQAMINVWTPYVCFPPHYHPRNTEVKILLEGKLLVVLYNLDGQEIERFVMTPEENYILYLQPGMAHVNIPLTEVVLFEVTPGPFVSEIDNVFLENFPKNMSADDVRKIVGADCVSRK